MRANQLTKISVALITVCVACAAGCGDDKGPSGPAIAEAWDDFMSGKYDDAIEAFETIVERNPNSVEALSGLGWAHGFNGEFASAKTNFQAATNGSFNDASMHAGFGAVLMALDDYEGAVLHANGALSQDSTWSFTYHTGIDYRDLRLLLAEAHFALGDSHYAMALDQVTILDPANGLNPNNSSTWGGKPSFAAALLYHIQQLEAEIGAEMLL